MITEEYSVLAHMYKGVMADAQNQHQMLVKIITLSSIASILNEKEYTNYFLFPS